MTGKLIDYALVIWCVIRDFLQSPTENRHIPFPSLVTNLMEAARMRGVVREKRILPKLGPLQAKQRLRAELHPRDLSLHIPQWLFPGSLRPQLRGR